MEYQAADELLNTVKATSEEQESASADEVLLSDEEKDALGEIGNICMGTSATTLSTLLEKKVSITTPRVKICRNAKDLGYYQRPLIVVEVSYTEGIDGFNIFLVKEEDVRIITGLLMGESITDYGGDIDELHFSAISEVMNQMVGASSTALADIIMRPVNISPPEVHRIVLEEDNFYNLISRRGLVIKVGFSMQIEGVLNSEIMQIVPFEFGKQLAMGLLSGVMDLPAPPAPKKPEKDKQTKPAKEGTVPTQADRMAPEGRPEPKGKPAPAAAPGAKPPASTAWGGDPAQSGKGMVGVKMAQYESFDDASAGEARSAPPSQDNIGLILDVPLQVTVELGKTKKSIKEILGLHMGSVIVLDRLAGELVDILVNGKLLARGEVVVIDDNYGIRVTEIISAP
ncbi:MAG: flagellar motor switch phosphatase FliY [Bacillota bacterium]